MTQDGNSGEHGAAPHRIKEAAATLGYVTPEDFNRWVRPEAMLGPRR